MDAKALLDSLMGSSRNQDLKEQKKNKGNNFKADSVCKHNLIGFCPAYDIAQTKLGKVKGGVPSSECRLTHSDALTAEFEAHPDHGKLKVEYERSLLSALDRLVQDADGLAKKERGTVKKNEQDMPGSTQFRKIPQSVQDEVSRLTKDMNKLMAAAEQVAEKGDVDGSKFKVMLADEIKVKIDELQSDYARTITHYREEQVCDVCGQRLEAFDPKNPSRHEAHFKGIVHNLYVKIRDWHKTLKDKIGDGDDRAGNNRRQRSRSMEGRSRDVSGDDRDRVATDRGDRERDRGDRGDRGRDRGRYDDRDGGRGGGRYDDRDRRGNDRDRRGGDRDRGRGDDRGRERSRSRRRS